MSFIQKYRTLWALFLALFMSVAITSCSDDDDDNAPENPATVFELVDDATVAGKPVVRVQDRGQGTGTRTWSADTVYRLDGFVFVNSNDVLTIEAGTIIQGQEEPSPNNAINYEANTSALIVARGARVQAVGTASNPIILTAEADDPNVGDDVPNPASATGLWGGFIILGDAPISLSGQTEGNIEGIPTEESRAVYGGSNATGNAGTLKYVSIRHTGAALSPGNEIQGLTLGGVGSGTTIDYVESFASSDDGIEIFGGNVNVTHFVSAFIEDDDFDLDQGWQGQGQYWLSIKAPDDGDHNGEWDGAKPDDADRFTNAAVYNGTFIGAGQGATTDSNPLQLLMRDGASLTVGNSIFAYGPDKALEVEDREDQTDSYQRFVTDSLGSFPNNAWYIPGKPNLDISDQGIIRVTDEEGETPTDPDASELIDKLTAESNVVLDQEPLTSVSYARDNGLDPRPVSGVVGDVTSDVPNGIDVTSYKGAFDPDQDLWLANWTALSSLDYTVQ